MRYKVEVVKNKTVHFHMIMQASAPGQVVRRATNVMKRENPSLDEYLIYVVNQKGEGWVYIVNNNNAKVLEKFGIYDEKQLYYVFTGNTNIVEVI